MDKLVRYNEKQEGVIKIDEKTITHPSFAKMKISRVYGGENRNLFMTNTTNPNAIRIEINTAEYTESDVIGREYVREGNNKITIEMSPMQFSELITTMNGEGVPVTIIRENNKIVKPPQRIFNKIELAENKIDKHMNNIVKEMKEKETKVKEILSKKSISKKDKDDIIGFFKHTKMQIDSNMDFLIDRAGKEINSMKVEALSEIEAKHMGRIIDLGSIEYSRILIETGSVEEAKRKIKEMDYKLIE